MPPLARRDLGPSTGAAPREVSDAPPAFLLGPKVDSAGAGAYYALDTGHNTARQLPLDPASRVLG